MKNLILGLCLALASCGALGTSTGYSRDNIQGSVQIVVERHDSYVAADEALTPEQRSAYLAESFDVTSMLQYDPIPAAPMRKVLAPVLARHDAYISADTGLTAPQQVQRLRTSQLLSRLLETNP